MAISLATAAQASAHPLGNFTIDHYSLLRPATRDLRVRYIVDMAEIPALEELPRLDLDGDGTVSPPESRAYLEATVGELTRRVTAAQDGRQMTWTVDGSSVRFVPASSGASSGVSLRIVLDLHAEYPDDADRWRLSYRDGNFSERAGWKEIVVEPGAAVRVGSASAPWQDRSHQLTQYPPEVLVPPQEVAADLELTATDYSRGRARGAMREAWVIAAAAALALLIRWRRRAARYPGPQPDAGAR